MTDRRLVDEIYSAALSVPADEREALVLERCGGDEALLKRVTSLLEASARSDSLVEDRVGSARDQLWDDIISDEDDAEEDLSGSLVGPWSVRRRIARGGLATVYVAHRSDGTYHQKVALKVLRRGLDTDDLVSRFRAERQILSSLEHPGISRILDGGALPDGRPYLVLEYVDGLSITDHCERKNLSIRARVRLMVNVSRAVHHAHQHLVVHRDIKPSNILASKDGKVSLLDFGIAKLLDPLALPTPTPLTRTGFSMLTPAYASPEQLAGETVTTASDIYQLGLILYELISGEKPFADDMARESAELTAPSKLIKENRRRRKVQGDLDAIVYKATHPDVARRYASADEFVADLQRYLDGLPVVAQPDTISYRLSKLGRRKPWLLPLIGIAAISIVTYVVTLSLYSERLAAEQRLTAATQDFFIDVFKSPDPFAPADETLGKEITVIEALNIGQARVRFELADQPELKARLLKTLSDVYKSLDDAEQAIRLGEEALLLQRELYGDRSDEVVASLRLLSSAYTGSGDLETGSRFADEQLALARSIYNESDPRLGVSEISSGFNAIFKGDGDAGMALLQQGAERLRRAPDEYAERLIAALVVIAEGNGTPTQEQAEAAVDEAFEVAVRVYGTESYHAASVQLRRASTMTTFGNYEGSEQNFLAVIPLLEQRLGESHSVTLTALNNLGYLYTLSSQEAKAENIHRRLLGIQIALHGKISRGAGDSLQNLAGAITRQGRYGEALPLHRKAHETYKAALNDDHYLIAFPLLSASYAELMLGKGSDAEASAREAQNQLRKQLPGSFVEGVAICLIGLSLEAQGQLEDGSALVESAHVFMKRGAVPDPYPELCRMPAGG